ncbi:MAG: hypothetical protein KF819_38100 [Labilithrix sp.]|nr:hypothetical protein [Labilithrix sp.]
MIGIGAAVAVVTLAIGTKSSAAAPSEEERSVTADDADRAEALISGGTRPASLSCGPSEFKCGEGGHQSCCERNVRCCIRRDGSTYCHPMAKKCGEH